MGEREHGISNYLHDKAWARQGLGLGSRSQEVPITQQPQRLFIVIFCVEPTIYWDYAVISTTGVDKEGIVKAFKEGKGGGCRDIGSC